MTNAGSHPDANLLFPPDFLWGVASSSFQIEGSGPTGARGESVWDVFCRGAGAIADGSDGALACDSFNRYREDVALINDLGVQSYRFSISWPRVMPNGIGRTNPLGLDYYDRLIDELLRRGLEPWPTLFHWDYPAELQRRGGWQHPDSPKWFAEYTAAVVERYSDRVTRWVTLNEPQVFAGLGHVTGVHAPGLKLPLAESLRIIHNALLGHGLAVRAIRALAEQSSKVGIAMACEPGIPEASPKSDSFEADLDAARARTFDLWPDQSDWFMRPGWYTDAVVYGEYPQQALDAIGEHTPGFQSRELEEIAQPIDFIGLNIYTGTRVRANTSAGRPAVVPPPKGAAKTAMGWLVEPESMYWAIRFFAERYNKSLYSLENGMAAHDWPDEKGRIHDTDRIDFTSRYIAQAHRAVQEGLDLRGYFHWSILDNFEWAEGYEKRFGLVHVDFESLKRTPKDSYHWFRNLIAAQPSASDGPQQPARVPTVARGGDR